MLWPRIIPCLLLEDGALVKTIGFRRPKYIGDPLNAVRIFNEKAADELMVLDIGASMSGRPPDFGLVARLAAECRMPFCYGGGVATVEAAERLIGLGVEKVAIGSAALAEPELVHRAAATVGRQSVVAVVDVLRCAPGWQVMTQRGARATGLDAIATVQRLQAAGAGEIVINSIDRDGTMAGYDLALAAAVRQAAGVPVTFLGGAGSLAHIGELIDRVGIVGAAAGSLFVLKGPYRAVLISYPGRTEKAALLRKCGLA